MTPENLRFTEAHEWVKIEGEEALIGISDYAQQAMGDIVYVELPEEGAAWNKGAEALNVESVKAAEVVYAPVSGTVTAVNADLEDEPEKLNSEPWSTWIVRVKLSDPAEADGLMDAAAYEAYLKTLE